MRRVLAAFKLNPYEVLDIPLSAVYDDPDSILTLVKKTYRTKSLLIHPFVSELSFVVDWLISPAQRQVEARGWPESIRSTEKGRSYHEPIMLALRVFAGRSGPRERRKKEVSSQCSLHFAV
jgi:hypothetical protein